jgi:hypothetical protein
MEGTNSMRLIKIGLVFGAAFVLFAGVASGQVLVSAAPDGDVAGVIAAETEEVNVEGINFGATVYANAVISSTGDTSSDCTIIVNGQSPDEVKGSSNSLKVAQKQKENPQLVSVIFGDPAAPTSVDELTCEKGKADAQVKTNNNEGKFSTNMKNCTGDTFDGSDASALVLCFGEKGTKTTKIKIEGSTLSKLNQKGKTLMTELVQ